MVLFLLYIKAQIEGVRSLSLREDANISISVRNPLSDYEVREKVAFNLKETVDDDGSGGGGVGDGNSREPPHHFGLRWDGCKKSSTLIVLDIVETKAALKKRTRKGRHDDRLGPPRPLGSDDNETWVPILAMEARGLEPYALHPLGDEFVVESEGGKIFADDVDLSEGDWADYDEDHDMAVSVSDFEAKFESL